MNNSKNNNKNNLLRVKKRDGRLEAVSFDKVLRRIQKLSDKLNVNAHDIAQNVITQIYDKVPTSELDELAARLCVNLGLSNPDYEKLALNIIISNNHKNTPDKFSDSMLEFHKTGRLDKKVYDFIIKNKEELDSAIIDERDYGFSWFSFKTLERAYLLRVNDKIIERIQYLFMRVSCGIHYPDLKEVIKSYNCMGTRLFTHATPTLYNAGTKTPQLLSCFLTAPEDDLSEIFTLFHNLALISKRAGGIGVSISCLRGRNSIIKSSGRKADGIRPVCRMVQETMRYVNQGGLRAGSAAVYLEPHHPDILEFLDLRLNQGNEEERTRDLFTALWISNLFMKRMLKNENWSLFDPSECPGLDEVYGEKYEELYLKYEKEGKAKKVIKAQKIWKATTKSMIETGTPYILFKDHSNEKSNHKHYGTIKGSNLCAEILEYHDSQEYACCCLSSICLPRFIENGKFDFEKLEEISGQLVRNLNKVIDRNLYPVSETKKSNMLHRPLGIGVQGLADVFCIMRIPFDSKEAIDLDERIFESIYYGAVKSSIELAKKEGHYETFERSPTSEGLFQFDLWKKKPKYHDFEPLRKEMIEHGLRNSLLVACMPTASTSQIMGNNETIEPFTSNIYTRNTSSGQFIVKNNYMIRDLIKLGLWNKELKDNIIANRGSIQNISNIPEDIKKLYKTAWEMKQKNILDHSIIRAPFICQTQSLNLYFEEPTTKLISSAMSYAWKNGLKTGVYYTHSRPKIQAQQFTIDPNLLNKRIEKNDSKSSSQERSERSAGTQNKNKNPSKPYCEVCSG